MACSEARLVYDGAMAMERLILFRHGYAEPNAPSGDDFDRRLAPRGAEESAETGANLAGLGFHPDVVLVSPAARARETWAAAQPAFPSAQTRMEDDLYHADPWTIRRLAEDAGGAARTVMVVAHNPGLQELTVELLRQGQADPELISRANWQFPTGAAAVFLFGPEGRPAFDGLFFPERRG